MQFTYVSLRLDSPDRYDAALVFRDVHAQIWRPVRDHVVLFGHASRVSHTRHYFGIHGQDHAAADKSARAREVAEGDLLHIRHHFGQLDPVEVWTNYGNRDTKVLVLLVLCAISASLRSTLLRCRPPHTKLVCQIVYHYQQKNRALDDTMLMLTSPEVVPTVTRAENHHPSRISGLGGHGLNCG